MKKNSFLHPQTYIPLEAKSFVVNANDIPVCRNDNTSPKKVWMVRHKLFGNLLEDFEGPDFFMNGAIKFIRLKQRMRIWTCNSASERKCQLWDEAEPWRGRSAVPGTWCCRAGARSDPCRGSPSAPGRGWSGQLLQWRLSQISATPPPGWCTRRLDPRWTASDAASNWESAIGFNFPSPILDSACSRERGVLLNLLSNSVGSPILALRVSRCCQ